MIRTGDCDSASSRSRTNSFGPPCWILLSGVFSLSHRAPQVKLCNEDLKATKVFFDVEIAGKHTGICSFSTLRKLNSAEVQNWLQERMQELPNMVKDLQGVFPSTKAAKSKEKLKECMVNIGRGQ